MHLQKKGLTGIRRTTQHIDDAIETPYVFSEINLQSELRLIKTLCLFLSAFKYALNAKRINNNLNAVISTLKKNGFIN